MDKWKGRYIQTAGGLLQAGAAYAFVAAGFAMNPFGGPVGGIETLLPGTVLGVVGLILWGKGARESLPRQEDTPAEVPAARVEDLLLTMQQDIAQLREDQDFFRELYSSSSAERRTHELPR